MDNLVLYCYTPYSGMEPRFARSTYSAQNKVLATAYPGTSMIWNPESTVDRNEWIEAIPLAQVPRLCFGRDLSAPLILSDPAVWGNSEPSQSSLYPRDLMLVLWDSIGKKSLTSLFLAGFLSPLSWFFSCIPPWHGIRSTIYNDARLCCYIEDYFFIVNLFNLDYQSKEAGLHIQ